MDPHTGVLPGLKVMVDRATRWKLAWQQSPLAASPQEVKDGVEDGTKVGGARVARPVAPPAEPGQPRPTPRRSGRCRRIECSSYGPFGPDQRFFKTDVNFSNTLLDKCFSDLLEPTATEIHACDLDDNYLQSLLGQIPKKFPRDRVTLMNHQCQLRQT